MATFPSSREQPPIRFGDFAELRAIIHSEDFDLHFFDVLVRNAEAAEAVSWAASIFRTYSGDEFLQIGKIAKTISQTPVAQQFPRCVVGGLWLTMDQPDETLPFRHPVGQEMAVALNSPLLLIEDGRTVLCGPGLPVALSAFSDASQVTVEIAVVLSGSNLTCSLVINWSDEDTRKWVHLQLAEELMQIHFAPRSPRGAFTATERVQGWLLESTLETRSITLRLNIHDVPDPSSCFFMVAIAEDYGNVDSPAVTAISSSMLSFQGSDSAR